MATTAVKARKAHLAIHVENVERSVDFYRRLFGIEPAKLRPGYAKFDVDNPPLNFTLNQGRTGTGDLSHLGIQLDSTGDVLAIRQQWVERGLTPRDEMQTDCCYALQDKTWVNDPDGNQWEAFVVLKDHLPAVSERADSCCAPASGAAAKSSCCTPVGAKG